MSNTKASIISLILSMLFVFGISSAQNGTTVKELSSEDQTKLQAIFKEWQDSVRVSEMNKLRFDNAALEAMANMGLPPKDYQLNISEGKFVIIPKPKVAEKK